MSKEDLEEDGNFTVDDIKRRGDDIRKRILDGAEVEVSDTAPNTFYYQMHDNSIGLNEISNVDMGYAGTRIDDSHIGKRQPYLRELEYNVNLMKTSDNAILILNGGLFTYVPKARNGQLLSYKDQIAYFYSLFKDLAKEGKIVAMVRGTEEHRILKNHGVDVYGILEDALGLQRKVCNDALLNIALEDDVVENASVGIRTINWNNTATTTAYIGRKMEERATKRGGADIYLARTTKNFFKKAVVGETHDGEIEKKSIYLISPGPYTPFKGALTAGAEYNSIKDGELTPNSFWYKISVEPSRDNESTSPYVVKVNPIQYVAHQISEFSTDKTLAAIMNSVEDDTEAQVRMLLELYNAGITDVRKNGSELIRRILMNNKLIAERNDEIRGFKKKKGITAAKPHKDTIVDCGTNIDFTND